MRMKKTVPVLLIIAMLLGLCACDGSIRQLRTERDTAAFSSEASASRAEALSAFANFIRENPYEWSSSDTDSQYIIDEAQLAPYIEQCELLMQAQAEEEESPYAEFASALLKLNGYVKYNEFILCASGTSKHVSEAIRYYNSAIGEINSNEIKAARESMARASECIENALAITNRFDRSKEKVAIYSASIKSIRNIIANTLEALESRDIDGALEISESFERYYNIFVPVSQECSRLIGEIYAVQSTLRVLKTKMK